MKGYFSLPVKNPDAVVKEKINDLYPLRVEYVSELPDIETALENTIYMKNGVPKVKAVIDSTLYIFETTWSGPAYFVADSLEPTIQNNFYYGWYPADEEYLTSSLSSLNNLFATIDNTTQSFTVNGEEDVYYYSNPIEVTTYTDDAGLFDNPYSWRDVTPNALSPYLQEGNLGKYLYENLAITVDQTFDRNSSNPQSGTALAEVINTYYGTCATSSATAAKVVICPKFTSLVTGCSIKVRFTYANTATSPTLNVNGTGGKSIKKYGATGSMGYMWYAGEVKEFVYDGSYWIMVDGGIATTTYYGVTKLNSSVTTNSYNTAATSSAVYTLNNSKEAVANKTTSLSSSSTDTQYPSAKAVYDFVMANSGSTNNTTNISFFNERDIQNNFDEISPEYSNFINYYEGQPYVMLQNAISPEDVKLYPMQHADSNGILSEKFYFSTSPWVDEKETGHNSEAIGAAIYASTITSLYQTIEETKYYYELTFTSGNGGPAMAYVEYTGNRLPAVGDTILYMGPYPYPTEELGKVEAIDESEGTITISAYGTYNVSGFPDTSPVSFTISSIGDELISPTLSELSPVGIITRSVYGCAYIGNEVYQYYEYDNPPVLTPSTGITEGTIWILDKNLDIDLSHCIADNFLTKELLSSDNNITIDTELSDTSENPVQNKAVKAYIDAAISGAIGGSY